MMRALMAAAMIAALGACGGDTDGSAAAQGSGADGIMIRVTGAQSSDSVIASCELALEAINSSGQDVTTLGFDYSTELTEGNAAAAAGRQVFEDRGVGTSAYIGDIAKGTTEEDDETVNGANCEDIAVLKIGEVRCEYEGDRASCAAELSFDGGGVITIEN